MSIGELDVVGRRACAVLAASSAALHGVMLGHVVNPLMGVLMGGMVVACLYCARELWLRGTLRVWVAVALMNLAMIALHLPAPVHHHAGAPTVEAPPTITALATLLAAVEVGLATVVLCVRSRRGAELVSGRPLRE